MENTLTAQAPAITPAQHQGLYELRCALGKVRLATTLAERQANIERFWALRASVQNSSLDEDAIAAAQAPPPESQPHLLEIVLANALRLVEFHNNEPLRRQKRVST